MELPQIKTEHRTPPPTTRPLENNRDLITVLVDSANLVQRRVAELERELAEEQAKNYTLRTDLGRIKANEISSHNTIKQLEDKINELRDLVTEVQNEKSALHDDLDRFRTEELSKLEKEIQTLKEEKNTLSASLDAERKAKPIRSEQPVIPARLKRQESTGSRTLVQALEDDKSSLRASLDKHRALDVGVSQESKEETQRLSSIIERLGGKVAMLKKAKNKYKERAKTYKEQLKAAESESAEAAVPQDEDSEQGDAAREENEDAGVVEPSSESENIEVQRKVDDGTRENVDGTSSSRKSTFRQEIAKLLLLPRRYQMAHCPKLNLSPDELSRTYEEIIGAGSFQDVFFLPGQIIHLPGTGHLLALFPHRQYDVTKNQWFSDPNHASMDGQVKDLFGSFCIKKSPDFTYFGRFRYHDYTQVNPDGYVLPKDLAVCMEALLNATIINIPDISGSTDSQKRIDDIKTYIRNWYLSGDARVVCTGLESVGTNQQLVDALRSKESSEAGDQDIRERLRRHVERDGSGKNDALPRIIELTPAIQEKIIGTIPEGKRFAEERRKLCTLHHGPKRKSHCQTLVISRRLVIDYEKTSEAGILENVLFPGRVLSVPGTPHYLGLFPAKQLDLASNKWMKASPDYSSLDGELKEVFATAANDGFSGSVYLGTFKCHYDSQMNPKGHALRKSMTDIIEPMVNATLTDEAMEADTAELEEKVNAAKARIRASYTSKTLGVICVGLQSVGFNESLVEHLKSPLKATAPVTTTRKRVREDADDSDYGPRPSLRRKKTRTSGGKN